LGSGFWPEFYLETSPIGQLIESLARTEVDFPDWKEVSLPWQPFPGIYLETKVGYVACYASGRARLIPQEISFVVAEEHCLTAAYQNKCPGVDPDALLRWRVEHRAARQNRPVGDLLRDIEEAVAAIKAAPWITIGRPQECGYNYCVHTGELPEGQSYCDCGVTVADLRNTYVPELLDAQGRLGVSVLYDEISGQEDQRKLYCAGDLVACRTFLRSLDDLGCDPRSGYGEPRRGVVGAYLVEREEEW
jgi:hypothetical protein